MQTYQANSNILVLNLKKICYLDEIYRLTSSFPLGFCALTDKRDNIKHKINKKKTKPTGKATTSESSNIYNNYGHQYQTGEVTCK